MEDGFVGVAEACKILGISRPTLRRLDADGVIRSSRNKDNHRVFTLEEVNRVKAIRSRGCNKITAYYIHESETTLRQQDSARRAVADPVTQENRRLFYESGSGDINRMLVGLIVNGKLSKIVVPSIKDLYESDLTAVVHDCAMLFGVELQEL